MKVTLDSSEPLADALRVVGAMYNVDLSASLGQRVRSEAPVTTTRTGRAAPRRANTRKAQTASKGRTTAISAAKKAKGPKRQPADRTNGSANAEVRSWAKMNGLTVKDRGRLPTSIIAAYRSAKSK